MAGASKKESRDFFVTGPETQWPYVDTDIGSEDGRFLFFFVM